MTEHLPQLFNLARRFHWHRQFKANAQTFFFIGNFSLPTSQFDIETIGHEACTE